MKLGLGRYLVLAVAVRFINNLNRGWMQHRQEDFFRAIRTPR